MTKKEARKIIVGVFDQLKLTKQERDTLQQALEVIEGPDATEAEKPKRKGTK